jgi:nucleotide-binding universal stress UspA family protein
MAQLLRIDTADDDQAGGLMYTRILIPLDGSKISEQVLPHARSLARGLKLPVELLQAADPEALALLTDPDHSRYADTVWGDRVASAKEYLNAVAASFAGVQVQCAVEKGKAEDVIIDKAAGDKDTLIAMATHGRSGIQRWVLGSVADKVLHGSSNHLFLVRASEQGKTDGEAATKAVVVPLDGSPLAEQVLPRVVEFVQQMALKIVLVRAYALPTSVAADEFGTFTDEMMTQLENEARDYLEKKAAQLKASGIRDVAAVVKFGYGGEEIISVARETPGAFVAMCTHGRSGIRRFALGSVTDRVVRHSGDPVLIVRAV